MGRGKMGLLHLGHTRIMGRQRVRADVVARGKRRHVGLSILALGGLVLLMDKREA